MIERIRVQGLKSIDDLKLEFSRINILVGTNSSGKSTLIQSILLASQSLERINCPLNGNLVSLGDFREVRNFITNAKTIDIDLQLDGHTHSITILETDREDSSELRVNNGHEELKPAIKDQLAIDEGLYYLSSSRIGHKDIYEKNYSNIYKFGLLGEYCLYYFEKHKDQILDKTMTRSGAFSNSLEGQVNYWLKHIIGVELSTMDIIGTDKIKASFRHGTRDMRTKNVGSGISYLISIIIMCLSLEAGDTIMIENPEIHLHPKAQSKLTEFLVFVAKANRQIILETHSDHIFNGIRVAVSRGELWQADYTINFFSLDEKHCTKVNPIEISKRGRVIDGPEGLFDQFEIDIDKMLGLTCND
jgi:predicted ATPase